MTVFVDVGAKRIQAYLARTPSLKGRRGASHLLDRARLYAVTAPAWEPVAEPNPAAKRTDGLLSFQLPGAAGLAAARTLVADAVGLLRSHAPGAEWEITIAEGSDYQDAQHARKTAEKAGRQRWMTDVTGLGTVAALAPPGEIPVVRLCDSCGLDLTVDVARVDGDDEYRCADCVRRLVGSWKDTPAETALLDAVRAASPGLVGAGLAGTFEDLARVGRDPRGNHLCTVFVDGNRFGALFTQLTGSGVDLGALSDELTAAMTGALVTATLAVTQDDPAPGTLPVIPHLIGGDDLLASVTAEHAWTFTRTLLSAYCARVAKLATAHGVTDSPTASAGMVFAHAKFPFATTVALAEEALRRAKDHHAAEPPAVLWIDVTADGPRVPGRCPPTLTELDDLGAPLRALAALPPSGLAQLGRLAERPGPYAADLAAAQAVRMGHWAAVRPFLRVGAGLPLADAVSLLRWWRN